MTQKITVNLDWNSVENIVVESLKADYKTLSGEDEPGLLQAIDAILDYYLSAEEYKQWKKEQGIV